MFLYILGLYVLSLFTDIILIIALILCFILLRYILWFNIIKNMTSMPFINLISNIYKSLHIYKKNFIHISALNNSFRSHQPLMFINIRRTLYTFTKRSYSLYTIPKRFMFSARTMQAARAVYHVLDALNNNNTVNNTTKNS